jgi:two-component system, OmpR family, sensor histidine kinase KdpD
MAFYLPEARMNVNSGSRCTEDRRDRAGEQDGSRLRAVARVGAALADRIAGTGEAVWPARSARPRPHAWRLRHAAPLMWATLVCAIATIAASALLRVFDLSNVVMLFLMTVVLIALRLGRLAGAWAALVCVGCFDFFFVEPRLSFAVSDTQYVFTFALMLAVALAIGQLAARLRAEARAARANEKRSAALARVAHELSAAIEVEQIAEVCTGTIAPLLGIHVALVLPDADDRLISPPDAWFVDPDAARWVYDHARGAGRGMATFERSVAEYLPLKAPMRVRGVLALLADTQPIPMEPDDQRLLDALCSSIALALERVHYVGVAQQTLVRMEGERLRHALLAAVSHDLKTPLTAIRGLAETLEQPERLAPGQPAGLARGIRRQAEALHGLVVNLLDLARMQSEGVRLKREWHMLDEIVGSALTQGAGVLAGRDVTTDVPADLPLIEVDALLIERVLMNLFDNAAKYAGADAAVAVRARAADGMVAVCVEDTGPGFAARDAERLFEPFERGRRESSIAGVGLGLALCRSIVTAHGGSIRALPREPHGACFEFRLPLGAPPAIERESRA